MKLTIVEFADVSGTGFDRQPDPAQPVDREYWACAQKLLARDVVQPPELIKATRGHPVWGMRRTLVGGQRMWCFWIQGRGGEFGPAGTCRFGFSDTAEHPVLVWRAGVEQVARQPLEQAKPEDAEALFQVIGSIGIGSKRIPIPGTPAQAARVIGGVLGVLPPAEIEERVWATCLLQPLDDQAVVAAPLPEAIAVAQYVKRIDRTLGSTMGGGMDLVVTQLQTLLRVPDRVEGVKRLAGHAMRGEFIYERLRSRPRTFVELLDCVNNELGDLTAPQVPGLLEDPAGRERLMSARPLVEEWVDTDPDGALKKVRKLALQPLVEWIFAGLVEYQKGADREVIGWPTPPRAGEADELWPAKLGELLRRCYPKPTGLVEFIKDLERRGVLSRGDLVRGRETLFAAGLKPKSARDLFPLTAEVIAASLRSAGALSSDTHDEIAGYRDEERFGTKLKLLSEAVSSVTEGGWLAPMQPGDAVRYFTAADLKNQAPTDENDLLAHTMAGCLAKAALSKKGQPGSWLIAFLKGLSSADGRKQGPKQMAALGALSVLDEWEFRPAQLPDRESLYKVVNALGIAQALTARQQALLQPQASPRPRPAAHEQTTVGHGAADRTVVYARRQGFPTGDRPADDNNRPKLTVARLRRLSIVAAALVGAMILLFATLMVNADNDNQTPAGNASRTKPPPSPSRSPSPSPSPVVVSTGSILLVNLAPKDVITAVQSEIDREQANGDIRVIKVVVSGNLAPGQRESLPAILQEMKNRFGLEPEQGETRGLAGTITVKVTFDRLG